MAMAPNSLHLWEDSFLYVTPAIHSGLTARSSATLLASASGRPFTLEAADGTRVRCTAALVAPHVSRGLDVDGSGLLSLNLEPASAAYRRLSGAVGTQGIQPIDARRFGRLREAFEGALAGGLNDGELHALSTRMVDAIAGRPAPDAPLDRRIERVLRMAQRPRGSLSLKELAAAVCLSPDRLTHLFREQAGLSIKRYLLWAKIRRTVQQFSSGRRALTDIALDSGFADAAHMSRTFQRCFGLPPSFLADTAQVRVTADAHASHAWGGGTPEPAA